MDAIIPIEKTAGGNQATTKKAKLVLHGPKRTSHGSKKLSDSQIPSSADDDSDSENGGDPDNRPGRVPKRTLLTG